MTNRFKRRDFIRDISLGSISLNISRSFSIGSIFETSGSSMISNNFFTISFNKRNGRVNVYRNDGSLLLNQVTARATVISNKISASGPDYRHNIEIIKISDKAGTGRRLIISSKEKGGLVDFTTEYTLYNNRNSILIKASCKNPSGKPVTIQGIEPVCAIEEIGAALYWNHAEKVLTNGPMYYDAGKICSFEEPYNEPNPYGPVKGATPATDFKYPAENRIRSWWNIGLFNGYNKESLVCGFVKNDLGLGQIILSKTVNGSLSLYTESVFAKGTELNPGKSLSSGDFLFNISGNPYSALEEYADIMGVLNIPRKKTIINGWCSWFYTYEFVTEEEVIRNAEFVSVNMKQSGLEYIQVDEGYQRFHGEWEGNDRFPHGMKWLAEKIKSYGLKPGIWFAPFIISEPTQLFSEHPEWLLKHEDGSLMRVGPWPEEDTDWARNENPRRYCLDISHPEAQKWLFNLFDTAANDWGYEMFKIDFVAWSILSAHHFFDRTYTPAMAYRKGIEIIRSAIGNEKHINDCGPGPVTTGLIDSMRIEIDQFYGFSDASWKQYFLDSSSSAQAIAKRYYFNNKTWINDADHICMNLLSVPEAQAAASLIALSGGNVISGDRLTELDNSKLEILKKIFPSFGEAARPVDLFDSDRHSVFSLNIKKPFGEWHIIGIFNTSKTEVLKKSIPLSRLGLDPLMKYVSYDFWMDRLNGEFSGSMDVKVQPASVTVLSLHLKKEYPHVISTDRHILQGAVEMLDVQWFDSSKTLRGSSFGSRHSSYNITVFMPEGSSWEQGRKSLFRDYENYSVKQTDNNLLRLHLVFTENEKINWEIRFNEAAI
jgi:hypothetical protein